MDECMLNDLLECSVCLERLDTSSKVLPCQHTFCKRCLEEIVTTHKELRCPECRILVDIKIDDLPPNVLLMRILEGMRNAPKKNQQESTPIRPTVRTAATVPTSIIQNNMVTQSLTTTVSERNITQINKLPNILPHQPYGRALYDYVSSETADLSFKKGDIVILKKRMDMHWYLGECNGKQGIFPSSFIQVMVPLPCHIPQCKALYDFRMTGDDEEGCLAFNKGAIINVIRRVDENWAEGRLNDRVGIFPLAFVELNGLARSLMKLSSNSQPGPSRIAPPTPEENSTTPLITAETNSQQMQHQQNSETSSSTVSSISPSTTSSSNTSSSSSTAPSSPTSPPPPRTATTNTVNTSPPRPTALHVVSTPVSASMSSSPAMLMQQQQQQREKRHSFSALNSGHHHHTSHRHSAEILSNTQDQQPIETNNVSNQHTTSRRSQNDTQNSSTNLPAAYIALYPYQPQKSDELELRKGGIYMVTERCQDGWFKGTSNRTQKCGVFPGNYVAPARGVPRTVIQSTSRNNAPPLEPRVYTKSGKPAINMINLRVPISTPSTNNSSRQPPELPPRSVSPAAPTSTSVSCSWHNTPDNTSNIPLGRSQSAVMTSTITSPSIPMKSTEKVKDRKEKGTVSLMRRLTSMKRSKSPPPTTYSIDNPVFEDNTSLIGGNQSPAHPVHVRSGSCPSQLLQALPADNTTQSVQQQQSTSLIVNQTTTQSSHHRLLTPAGTPTTPSTTTTTTGSQRTKHNKERAHIMQITSMPSSSRHLGDNSSNNTTLQSSPNTNHHRKSNSLDSGAKATAIGSSSSNTNSSSNNIRERFRCIVPYPPNSEYELELRLNDIIYVHKKRDDGWYKGTQQRTGRTGLFPASFVESF